MYCLCRLAILRLRRIPHLYCRVYGFVDMGKFLHYPISAYANRITRITEARVKDAGKQMTHAKSSARMIWRLMVLISHSIILLSSSSFARTRRIKGFGFWVAVALEAGVFSQPETALRVAKIGAIWNLSETAFCMLRREASFPK